MTHNPDADRRERDNLPHTARKEATERAERLTDAEERAYLDAMDAALEGHE